MANEYLASIGEAGLQVFSSSVEIVTTESTGAGLVTGATIGIVLGVGSALSGAASVIYVRHKRSVRSRLRRITAAEHDRGTFEPEEVVAPRYDLKTKDILGYTLKSLEKYDDDDDLSVPVAPPPLSESRPVSSYYIDNYFKRVCSKIR